MAKRRDEREQEREVAGWRNSGLSAAKYALRRGYSVTSLFTWAKRASLVEAGGDLGTQRFVRLEVAAPHPVSPARVVIEIGSATVAVERGFDPELLRAVVDALGAGREK
jgi:hypothetical protein